MWWLLLLCRRRCFLLVAVVALSISTVSGVMAQATNTFDQLTQLKLNQPLPESLQKQAESVSKRGDKQTYYFLSGNYVYPHFIETQHGLVVHVAVYLDKSKTAEYSQKLQAIGSPEIVLQNTETESVFGFPTKGIVFVVNNQKQPVVYEWMQPRTEREIVQTYDTETVLAAADTIEASSDPRELLLKYPSEVVALAVGFYTAIISNPKLAVVVLGVVIALVITIKIIKAVKMATAQQRESRITKLMEETLAINRQRTMEATVAETVVVPTHHSPDAPASNPVFDVSTVESAPIEVVAESDSSQSTPVSHLSDKEQAAATAAYAMPATEELEQMEQHNPQLRDQISAVPHKPETRDSQTSDMPVASLDEVGNTVVNNDMTSQPVTVVTDESSLDQFKSETPANNEQTPTETTQADSTQVESEQSETEQSEPEQPESEQPESPPITSISATSA